MGIVPNIANIQKMLLPLHHRDGKWQIEFMNCDGNAFLEFLTMYGRFLSIRNDPVVYVKRSVITFVCSHCAIIFATI